jgi:iron complex transport system substrate-binding protein
MTGVSRRTLLAGAFAVAAVGRGRSAGAQTRTVVDSVGRRVELPVHVGRVMPAGPPASILLYAVAPESMMGWVPAPSDEAKPFLLPSARAKPAIQRLTARGAEPDLAAVGSLKPDLILDFGSTATEYAALADKVQAATHVPYVLIDGALDKLPAALQLSGQILGHDKGAQALATYAEQTLDLVEAVLAKVPAARRRKVFVARGAEALATAVAGSGLTEVVEKAGAINVAQANAGSGKPGRGGTLTATLDEVIAWNPEIVIAFDRPAWEAIGSRPDWKKVPAVAQGRLYAAPTLPWGWLGEPPSLNRLMGLRWMLQLLYPAEAKLDLRREASQFHELFYGVMPADADLDRLLAHTQ